jgi:hypothetical protein
VIHTSPFIRSLIAFFLFSVVIFGQTVPPKTNTQTSAKPPVPGKNACAEAVSKAQTEAYSTAFNFSAAFYETKIAVGKDQKLKIRILIEDNLENTDAFRFAAAEVIRTQFGEKFEIDPAAQIILYITGTKPLPVGTKNAQMLNVQVVSFIQHSFNSGDKSHMITGEFEFTSPAGGMLSAYSAEEKTQEIREDTYSVLSKFLENWALN